MILARCAMFLIWAFSSFGEEPLAFYAVYQKNPESAMTLCLVGRSGEATHTFFYKLEEEAYWTAAKSQGVSLGVGSGYFFHRVDLNSLEAGACYQVIEPVSGRTYHFQTLPSKLAAPFKFVVGGDIYHDSIQTVEKMNRVAASFDPAFAVLGGDIAYAAPPFMFQREKLDRWLTFLNVWSQTMVTKEGRLIPALAVIGNHDVKGRYGKSPGQAQFFYLFFPSPHSGYWKFQAGNYLRLWLLDTGHAHPIQGRQTAWLEESLEKEKGVPYRFAIYHVPAFPCVRDFDNKKSREVRKYWPPLFEKAGLTAAFEHHDHAYKRTHAINGVVYFGDGAWGISQPRKPHGPEVAPYLAKSASATHIMLVTLGDDQVKVEAINQQGEPFDEWRKMVPSQKEGSDSRGGDLGTDCNLGITEQVGQAA